MPDAKRFLIADDHPLVREGLGLAIQAAIPGAIVDGAGSIAEAEALVAGSARYSLVLLDLVLPDTHGFSGFLTLQHALGRVPIAIVSATESPDMIAAARALGAAGFLSKGHPIDQLADMLRRILAGRAVFPAVSANSGALAARERLSLLSSAQLRVLLALAGGQLNKQIAGDLGVTEATIKAHLTAIFRKLNVNNRTQAILAMQPLLGDARAAVR